MPPYAHCFFCGTDFDAGWLDVGNSTATNVSIQNVGVTCPNCGMPARSMEGTFNLHPGRTEIVQAPAWTRALVHRMTPAQARRVGSGVAWAIQTVQQQPEAEAEVETKLLKLLEREAPWLASFVKVATSSKVANFATIVTFVFMMLTVFGVIGVSGQPAPQPVEIQISDEQLQKMFDEWIEQHQEDEPQPQPSPTPTAPNPEQPPTIEA